MARLPTTSSTVLSKVNGVALMRCRSAVYISLPVLFSSFLSIRYLIPTGHVFTQPNLKFPVRSFSSFDVQGASIMQFRRVGNLTHHTVLLMHLCKFGGTRSCRMAPVCCSDIARHKPEGVRRRRRTAAQYVWSCVQMNSSYR